MSVTVWSLWTLFPWVHNNPRAAQELAELRADRGRMRAAKQSAAERLSATQGRWAAVNGAGPVVVHTQPNGSAPH